jgi:hypothetical protein
VLGIHVQRLATIARGDAACTTHVPHSPRANATDPMSLTEESVRKARIPDGGEPA